MSNEPTGGSQQTLSPDTAAEERPFRVGDHVTDREENEEKPMLVAGMPGLNAREYRVEGANKTVAELNSDYPETAPVFEVVFMQRTDADLDGKKRYAYPVGRLKHRHPVHPTDEESDER